MANFRLLALGGTVPNWGATSPFCPESPWVPEALAFFRLDAVISLSSARILFICLSFPFRLGATRRFLSDPPNSDIWTTLLPFFLSVFSETGGILTRETDGSIGCAPVWVGFLARGAGLSGLLFSCWGISIFGRSRIFTKLLGLAALAFFTVLGLGAALGRAGCFSGRDSSTTSVTVSVTSCPDSISNCSASVAKPSPSALISSSSLTTGIASSAFSSVTAASFTGTSVTAFSSASVGGTIFLRVIFRCLRRTVVLGLTSCSFFSTACASSLSLRRISRAS